jgi:hypothetical protein
MDASGGIATREFSRIAMGQRLEPRWRIFKSQMQKISAALMFSIGWPLVEGGSPR